MIPLAPEAIQNTDGTEKQDCEINAGKRLIKKVRKTHPKLKIIVGGDDLFSNQPFIDELKAAGMSFIHDFFSSESTGLVISSCQFIVQGINISDSLNAKIAEFG